MNPYFCKGYGSITTLFIIFDVDTGFEICVASRNKFVGETGLHIVLLKQTDAYNPRVDSFETSAG